MTKYVAMINTPGYLPDSVDAPVIFHTAQEAWEYLADERKRAEDESPEWSDHECPVPEDCEYSDTYAELSYLAVNVDQWGSLGSNAAKDGTGTVQGETPGYEGDHDLGVAYSVEPVEGECEITQLSEDGADDGLTWYHCATHDEDTLSEIYCAEGVN